MGDFSISRAVFHTDNSLTRKEVINISRYTRISAKYNDVKKNSANDIERLNKVLIC